MFSNHLLYLYLNLKITHTKVRQPMLNTTADVMPTCCAYAFISTVALLLCI